MVLTKQVAPSLLSGDFARLAEECDRMVEYGADYLHMDVMDGHFVPNLTIGSPVIKSLRKHSNAFLDCHMMVSNPEKWVKDFANAGASLYMFHYEATNDHFDLIQDIKNAGMKVGMAIKPATNVQVLDPYLNQLDMVLIMTVEPGFGGQSLIPECLTKVRQIRDKCPNLDIEVDGGITLENLKDAVKAGANVFVAGSLIFGSKDPRDTIARMKKIMNE